MSDQTGIRWRQRFRNYNKALRKLNQIIKYYQAAFVHFQGSMQNKEGEHH